MHKFYNREEETTLLKAIEKRSKESAEMTFVVGRRRVGKTALLKNTFSSGKRLYFFAAKKNESLLCEEFTEEIISKLGVPVYGKLDYFKQLFTLLMDVSQHEHFTLIIDEFQEFGNINQAVYSDMQNIWDSRKNTSKLNLVLCGSVYSLMTKIFQNAKEPLFGRSTAQIHLKPFNIQTLKEILTDYHPNYSAEDLLAFYTFTGGVAKYVELLVKAKAFTKKRIINELLAENSIFIEEGKNVLIDEFGKDYGNYFSVLSLIASSKNSRSEMESTLKISIGGYLDKLENEFNLIKKIRPFRAKPAGKNVKYQIEDNFLNFWFRFVYKYRSAVEIGNFEYLRNILERDYETYSGLMLEKYFRQKLMETKQFSEISNYWDRKGENEIDIIALNEMEKRIVFFEVKRNTKRISISLLKQKAKNIMHNISDYTVEHKGLSMGDM
jgi:AAA+ ATPase superfamily predicted ATPase